MSDGSDALRDSSAPPTEAVSRRLPPRRREILERIASVGASAQAAIPGLYAWSITVAPAAWSRGAPVFAKAAALVGVVALVTAPLIEGARVRSWTGPTWARAWSVWGFVLSSAIVWVLTPVLSSALLDDVRGVLGMIGWALFAFASAGPVLRPSPNDRERRILATSLGPTGALPRGDGAILAVGVVLALSMQAVGWGVSIPERAVLVRLVTVVCGIAVLGGSSSIALARHGARSAASVRLRLRRAFPWLVMLALFALAGLLLGIAR